MASFCCYSITRLQAFRARNESSSLYQLINVNLDIYFPLNLSLLLFVFSAVSETSETYIEFQNGGGAWRRATDAFVEIRMGYWPSLFGQDGWILAKFFFWVFMDRDEVEVHKHAKKERGQYPTILTEHTWSIKDLLYSFRGNFSCGIQRVVPSGQDGSTTITSINSMCCTHAKVTHAR